MAPASHPDQQLNINLSSLPSALDAAPAPPSKSPFSGAKATPPGLAGLSGARMGAGSPLHEQASRLFPKRTRELQSATGLSPNIWGPPTSGTSTPLFEIPESPSQDGFPDLVPLTESGINSPARRGRAGTLPSRISAPGGLANINTTNMNPKTSRPTPSTSPFRPGSAAETAFNSAQPSTNNGTANLLSRLRAGSMPQRASILGPSNVFGGGSAFGATWTNTRGRAATLNSISSAEDAASPSQPGFSRDGMGEAGVRTLDYLGLAETPQQSRAEPLRNSGSSDADQARAEQLANFHLRNQSSRFRSFSVNTQPQQYNMEHLEDAGYFQNGTLTPSGAAALEAEYEAVQEKVRLHNQAVQAFAVNASAARPRARTAGLVETPQRTSLRNLVQGTSLEDPQSSLEMQMHGNELTDALNGLSLGDGAAQMTDGMDEADLQPSRSLWIGSIPNSTTMSSLDAIFNRFGPIESTRVLTHKNCGFVNFENADHAIRARQLLNGKEIFPGAGPVRIGFAKAPTSNAMTPSESMLTPTSAENERSAAAGGVGDILADPSVGVALGSTSMIDRLTDLQSEILQIVTDFGAPPQDIPVIAANIQSAASYRNIEKEVPPIPEPSPSRVYDAPRLRDIRKRIDNGTCALQEIESIAMDMLPEIAELSSDYLGNTVVQKMFEFCSEPTKDQMLIQIAPRLAEIGVHKNGTWAAQKIIDVCKSENQMRTIVENVRPYTVPLFLDQYGNYVLQCCLRFGAPYNDFIFETMLSQLGEVSQGRFGARAMRACLESHYATKPQQRMIAAAVALSSTQLATNANGALLLTWLLDTCSFPRRRSVLAPRLAPHLVQLCTHKVAYLTVLKVINQRNEPEARDLVLKALFFGANDGMLEQILRDQASGVTLIFKILTTPFLDDNMRPDVVRNITKVLSKIKAQPNQGYKRLMDEVGMSTRPGSNSQQSFSHSHPSNDRRPMTQPAPPMSHPAAFQRQYSGTFMPNLETGASPVRSGSADPFGYPGYNMNAFGAQPNYGGMQYQQMTPQSQYQSYGAGAPRSASASFAPPGFNAYGTPSSSIEPFRMQNQAASPVPFSASPVMSAGVMPQGFSQNMPSNMYGYQQQQQYFYSPTMQPVHTAGRGRRV
jgi:protein JSN1